LRSRIEKLLIFSIFLLIIAKPVAAQTTYSLLIFMDGDVSIGPSAEKDNETATKCLKSLESWKICQLSMTTLRSSQDKVTSRDVMDWLRNIDPSSDDAVMVYYSGHGFINEEGKHFVWFGEDDYVPRSEIINELRSVKCRLKMLITDACSNMVSLPTPVTSTPRSLGETRDKQYYRNLFIEHEGLLDVTAASEGEYAWGNTTVGGYFTASLFAAFSGEGKSFRSWQDVIFDAQIGTQRLFSQTTFPAGDERRMQEKGISNQTPKSYSIPIPTSTDVEQPVKIQTPLKPSITPSDDSGMVLIPAGKFQMGTDRSDIPGLLEWIKGYDTSAKASWFDDEAPQHSVYLDDFYISAYEVTNAQYKKFLEATGHTPPEYWDDPKYNDPDQPVVGVSYNDAVEYCDWAGMRLPTEAEWEKAARGGLIGKIYPWGNDPSHDYANYAGTVGNDIWSGPAPAGSFEPNGYGIYDMAGNVFEWCADYYDKSYYSNSSVNNPKGPASGSTRVVRGGGFGYTANSMRVADRFGSYFANKKYPMVGFRCVR